MHSTWFRALFAIAGMYDGLIGLAFLTAGHKIFEGFSVPPPNHWAYIEFTSALLIIFGLMFFSIALKPEANRNLIPYAMLLKVSYIAVAGYYWVLSDIPWLFKPFAIIDAVMLVLFALAYGHRPAVRPGTLPDA